MPDLSFFPEPYFLENGINNPVQFGQENRARITRLLAIADLILLPFAEAKKGIHQALRSEDPWQRYWALIVCSSFAEKARPFYRKANKIARQDPENLVRMRALEFLALSGQEVHPDQFVRLIEAADSKTEANLMLNTVALLKMQRPELTISIPRSVVPTEWITRENDLVNRRLDFINQ
jgi:hypothetical protein